MVVLLRKGGGFSPHFEVSAGWGVGGGLLKVMNGGREMKFNWLGTTSSAVFLLESN